MGLPKEVWYVESKRYEGEEKKYYSVAMNRLYRNRGGVKAFIDSNKRRKFKIYRATVTWEEVDIADVIL